MKNVSELRDELASVIEDLRKGHIEYHAAKEINNSAGKMINTLKVQLEYAHLRKEPPNVQWLAGKQ